MYKIMIIDDDPTSLAIGKALLEDKYEVSLARSAHQALGALIRESLPDVILLDMVMPGIDGIALLRKFKQNDQLKNIPVIFLTSEDDLDVEVQSYCNGASDFLQKPVSPDMLWIKIRQQLSYIELQKENKELKSKLLQLRETFESMFKTYLQ